MAQPSETQAEIRRQTPAWAVSLLVHVVALLAMALIVTTPPPKDASISIVSAPAEEEEDFEDIEQPTPEPPEENTDAEDPVPGDPSETLFDDPIPLPEENNDPPAATVDPVDIGDLTGIPDIAPRDGIKDGAAKGVLSGRRNHGQLALIGGGDGTTESAVDRAIRWILEHQMADGGWSFDLKACPSCQGKCSHGGELDDRCAATSLALLPLLARGYTHKDGPHKKQCEAGIAYLAGLSAKGEGRCYDKGGSMYSQGLAGIALSEAYAMTQDNRLQAPAQMALYFIEQAQDPVGGGWRYGPKQAGDTSAVGWQLMALKSGNMAYLNVNAATIKKAIEFLDSVEDDSGAYYGYTGPGRGQGTTAVGLLCRMYLGWKKDHPALQRGVEFLAKKGPSTDLYFSYYATQVMHHMEGDEWRAWNTKMKEMLLKSQATEGHEAGSWFEGVEGGHGAHKAGRLYCTSLATMMLEVYYRHLPIYRGAATEDEFRE